MNTYDKEQYKVPRPVLKPYLFLKYIDQFQEYDVKPQNYKHNQNNYPGSLYV